MKPEVKSAAGRLLTVCPFKVHMASSESSSQIIMFLSLEQEANRELVCQSKSRTAPAKHREHHKIITERIEKDNNSFIHCHTA